MTTPIQNSNHKWYRWLVYTIIWGWLWAYPLVAVMISAAQGKMEFSWQFIVPTWMALVPFFLLFLANHLLLHVLLPRKLMRWYVASAVVLLAGFLSVRYMLDYPRMHDDRRPPKEFRAEGHRPPGPPRDADFQKERREVMPPMPLALDLVIGLLMMGCDFALMLLSRYQQEQEAQRQLRATHLQHELEYLKAQIHPHFFMNMLNNIHGMVELHPQRAQEMIMELSKLMRYVLYDGSLSLTSLQKEQEFIANYVHLLGQRYSSKKVTITVDLPAESHEDVMVPPLLFVSVVENAFKHGISYLHHSYVAVRLMVDEQHVTLTCENSVHPQQESHEKGGVGLSNLRQRLSLIYGDRYTLDIQPSPGKYLVTLIIPRAYETNTLLGHR